MRLFAASSRRRHSHGHRYYSPPNLNTGTFSIDSLVTLIAKPLGVHHIRTKLYSLPLQRFKSLFDESKSILLPDSNSPKYWVIDIILDVNHHRLYKPVLTNSYTPEKRKFLNLHFGNKGLDAINIANLFHHKSLQANVPAYFTQQAAPIISYTYTSTIASNIFNHRKTLQHLNIDDPV